MHFWIADCAAWIQMVCAGQTQKLTTEARRRGEEQTGQVI